MQVMCMCLLRAVDEGQGFKCSRVLNCLFNSFIFLYKCFESLTRFIFAQSKFIANALMKNEIIYYLPPYFSPLICHNVIFFCSL